MRGEFVRVVVLAFLSGVAEGQSAPPKETPSAKGGQVTLHSDGLHGYIGFSVERPPVRSAYSAGMGFYSAVWPLIDQPLADFQIGLAGSWITPDNSDNQDQPLAPEGTLARTWKERGPTWQQRLPDRGRRAGLLGGKPLPLRSAEVQHECHAAMLRLRDRIARMVLLLQQRGSARPSTGHRSIEQPTADSPRCAALPGKPERSSSSATPGWPLPFTDPTTGDPPTGDQSWTCFLSAANFKGPIAYYIPETWSKIGKLFNYPFLYGRGLDARPGNMGGGAMEINTVPRFDATTRRVSSIQDPQAAVPGG